MSTIGFVKKVNTKSGTGRNGKPYTLHSLKLADKDGNELPGWYQCGFDKPSCKEGDYVKLEAVAKGNNFDVVKGSVKVSKNPPAAPAGSSGGGAAPAKVKESDLFGTIGGYNTEDDVRRMTYSNSRSAAVDVVRLLYEADALGIPKSSGKASSASRYDIITAAVDKLTVEYFFDAASGRKLESVADNAPDTEGDGPLPDEDEFDDEIPFDAPVDEDDDFE